MTNYSTFWACSAVLSQNRTTCLPNTSRTTSSFRIDEGAVICSYLVKFRSQLQKKNAACNQNTSSRLQRNSLMTTRICWIEKSRSKMWDNLKIMASHYCLTRSLCSSQVSSSSPIITSSRPPWTTASEKLLTKRFVVSIRKSQLPIT